MTDQAIVVGIETYPGMQNLQGPCNDAEAFRDWLVDVKGGGLDPTNVTTLLTRDYPPSNSIANAHPVLSELEQLFRPLVVTAAKNQHTNGRLFIFAAGHGFADSQDVNSAALFTADAEFLFPPHLAVVAYANFFRRAWAFDEVILIIDACRSTNALQQIGSPPLPRINAHPNSHKVKSFVGFGSGFNQEARERAFNGGPVHGIFTAAVLDALKNAPPNSAGQVNGTSVKRHVHNSIGTFAGSVTIAPPEIVADEEKDVLFVKRAASHIDVEFVIDAANLNATLVIEFGGVNEVHRGQAIASPVIVPLLPGLYKASIDGRAVSTIFEVPSDVRVTL